MLKDKVVFITGGSRGIGREIALKCAADGAKVVIAAKTVKEHPVLSGTIHTVAEEIELVGGKALAIPLDVRDEQAIKAAMELTANTFGGIDIVVNNASAISLSTTIDTSMKQYDLMNQVNVRATFAVSQAAWPYLCQANNPHVLNLSPPLNLNPRWFAPHLAYTMSKYGMSLCVLGLSEEWRQMGIKVNALWPKTTIATAAISHHFPTAVLNGSRSPAIVADAAYYIFKQTDASFTGKFFIDEDLLRQSGLSDFSHYAPKSSGSLYPDLFLD